MWKRERWTVSRRSLLAVMLAAGGITVTRAAFADATTDSAKAFIANLANEAVAALAEPDISPEERASRARSLLNENFAIPFIGASVMGRYWRVATDEEKREYLGLFRELIVTTYVNQFSRFAGISLDVTGARAIEGSGDVIVESKLNRPDADPVDVGWRVRQFSGQWKIIDVIVNGLSLGQTQRDEFTSVIRNGGNKVSALLDEMRRRVSGKP